MVKLIILVTTLVILFIVNPYLCDAEKKGPDHGEDKNGHKHDDKNVDGHKHAEDSKHAEKHGDKHGDNHKHGKDEKHVDKKDEGHKHAEKHDDKHGKNEGKDHKHSGKNDEGHKHGDDHKHVKDKKHGDDHKHGKDDKHGAKHGDKHGEDHKHEANHNGSHVDDHKHGEDHKAKHGDAHKHDEGHKHVETHKQGDKKGDDQHKKHLPLKPVGRSLLQFRSFSNAANTNVSNVVDKNVIAFVDNGHSDAKPALSTQDVDNFKNDVNEFKELTETFNSKGVKNFVGVLGKVCSMAGGLASFVSIGLSLFAQDDQVSAEMQALADISNQIDEGFNRISGEIKQAITELKAYGRELQFENEVESKMNNLMFNFKTYIKDPKEHTGEFLTECMADNPTAIINSILTTLGDNGLRDQLKAVGCTSKGVESFINLYQHYVSHASLVFPFCELLKNNKSMKALNETTTDVLSVIKRIDEKLNIDSEWCTEIFFHGGDNMDNIQTNAEALLNAGGSSKDIATSMLNNLINSYGDHKDINIAGTYKCDQCVYSVVVSEDKHVTGFKCKVEESYRYFEKNGKKMWIFAQPSNSQFTESNSYLNQAINAAGKDEKVIIEDFVNSHHVNCALVKSGFHDVDFAFVLNDKSVNANGNHGFFELGEANSVEYTELGKDNTINDIVSVVSAGYSDTKKPAWHYYLITAGNGQQVATMGPPAILYQKIRKDTPLVTVLKDINPIKGFVEVGKPVAHELGKFANTLGSIFGKK